MDITPIFICAVVFGSIYKTFELFVHKKERLRIIDMLESIQDFQSVNPGKLSSLFDSNSDNRYSALRWGLFAVGLGLGMIAFVTATVCQPSIQESYELESSLCSALALLGGGLGLVIAFLIENNMRKSKKE